MDRVFTRVTAIAISICAVLCFVFTGLVMALYGIESRFATRLLPPWPTLLFALGILLIFIPDCQWTYIHAHKRSPYLMLTFLGAGLSAAGIVWLGSVYGALGTSIAYLGVNALFYLPVWSWVWFACRREWHSGH